MPKVKAVCISDKKGQKHSVSQVKLIKGIGVEGDFHAKGGGRQISLLAKESIQKMKEQGLKLEDGAFGENVVTEGLDLTSLSIGQHLKIGESEIVITKIGKECVNRCAIFYKTGDCIMPKEGIFGKVIKDGVVMPGDEIL